MKRLIAALVLTGASLGVGASVAGAHPLGNFTTNQYSGLTVTATGVVIDVVLDEAEIPAFRTRSAADTNHDGTIDDAESATLRQQQCNDFVDTTTLAIDGQPLVVRSDPTKASLAFPAGQAGLFTLRVECSIQADLAIDGAGHTLSYTNGAFSDRIGWREIVVGSDGLAITSGDVARESRSSRLTQYPSDLLRSAPDNRSATFTFKLSSGTSPQAAPAGSSPTSGPEPAGAARLLPRGADRATQAFTDLVARHRLTLPFALGALALAVALGSLHALAPGHGKTVMAAYIVGQKGSLRQAALIGGTVTATHTAGVLTLGIILTTSNALAPERLYPWLGMLSGLLLAGIGLTLARRALRLRWPNAKPAQRHDAHSHGHSHADHGHADHGHGDHHHVNPGRQAEQRSHSHGGWAHSHPDLEANLGWRSLITVGFAGGMVPSPSALLVLLGAIALGRTWFGLLLVTAYGLGMAAMLTGAGLLLVRARNVFERRREGRASSARLVSLGRLIPVLTSVVIVVAGLTVAARAAGQL